MRKPCLKFLVPAIILLFSFTTTHAQQVVISQVYGGGGNSGATLTHDFIEIFNRGNTPVSLNGWSVQYASVTGTAWSKTDLTNVTLQPGQYYLIQEAIGAGGTTALPTPDVIGTIAMAGTNGKVALVNSTTLLSGSCPSGVIDIIGYGPTASCFETTPTPLLSNTTAAIRKNGGCTDSNNNNTDFAIAAPTPRNTSTPLAVCGVTPTTVSVAAGVNATEAGTNGTFVVTLSAPAPVGGITVTYTLGGSTTNPGDYSDALSGSITIPEAATAGTITLVPFNDNSFEGTETITITLNTATAPYTIATPNASIDLVDNDAPPTVSVAAEINAAEPATDGTFTVTLSTPAPAGGITVTYTLGGTAGGSDYTDPQAGTITIAEAAISGSITIDVTDDPDTEPVETITITLNTVTAPYTINTGNASINLSSDDFGPIAITSGNVYTQDFNSLAITGTLNSLGIEGWQMDETGNGARDNELYAADNGGSNTGDTYSYGTTGSNERALGSLLSGSLISKYGAYFINQTGGTINSIRITYMGEEWRLGTASRTDKIDFQYSLDATSVTNGNWIHFDQLDFITPNTAVTGSKDGNAAANRKAVGYTINGLNIPAGGTFFIRFADADGASSDDGLAVDDFTLEANPIDNAGPAYVALNPANNAVNVPLSTTAEITFDEDLQVGTGNIYVIRSSDNFVVQTLPVNGPGVTLNVNKLSFTVTGLAYGTTYYIEMDGGTVSDLSNNDFAGISGNGTWSFSTEPPPPPGVLDFTYNFDACNTTIPGGFTQYSSVGEVVWGCTTFGRDASDPTGQASLPNGVQINGFTGGTNVPNVDWLISPPFDLTGTNFPLLSFWSRTAFNGLPLALMVSTNYTGGNPASATWTEINGRFPQQTSNVWTLSSNINLSAYKQSNVHFAFVYTSSDDDGARWTLDDITVNNSAVPPPPSLTVSTNDIQFTYVASGSDATKTFVLTGNDLTSDMSLASTGAFTISKDGFSFSNSISYTVAEANNVSQTVYVRFAPPAQNQGYSGTVTVTSGALSEIVNVSGSSIDPATTLEVVNWNIEWFGSTLESPTNDNQQEQNVRTILQSIGADVYALTEIVDEARLASVVSAMPGYAYVISNYGSHTNTTVNPPSALANAQKLAFIYKTSILSNVSATPLLSQGINSPADITNPAYNYYASGRFPYMLNADVTLNCVTTNVKFVLVHAKANTSPTATSYDRRKRGADTLHFTLQQNYPNDNIIILGDFNDDLDQTITAGINPPVTSYSTFINDPANFTPVTLPLSLAGKKSTVSYNDVIDHAMVSNEMAARYMPGSASILTDVTSLVSNYAGTTSDHYPVFHRYTFPNTVSPQVTTCPVAGPFCASANGQYTIPEFVAADDCDPVTYSYSITGATQRLGNTNNASGVFNPGTSTINWTATDSWGNSISCQTTVIVGANLNVTIPDAMALPYGVLPNTVYIGYDPAESLTLVAQASGGAGGYTYLWTGGSSNASITVSPTTTTTYTVTVKDANNCQNTATKTVTVMDIRENKKSKKVLICHKPDQQNATKIVNVNAVQDHLDHGDMLGSCICPDPEYSKGAPVVEEPGVLTLQVTGYPNPSSTGFNLVISGVQADAPIQLRITDMQGRLIEQKQQVRSHQVIQFGAGYRAGTYFAEVSTGREKKVIKLVKL